MFHVAHIDDRRVTFDQKFFPEDTNQQEQNVPQQIDLTCDDDDSEDLNEDDQEIGKQDDCFILGFK